MSSFIYTGFEPDSLNGNDTALTADSAGSVGASDTGSGIIVDYITTFTGDVSSFDATGGTGVDPADFITMSIGEYTTQVEVGFELTFGETLSGLFDDGVIGGSFALQIIATGAVNFSHTLGISFGFFASFDEQMANLDIMNTVITSELDAFYQMIGGDYSAYDTTIYEFLSDMRVQLDEINGDLGTGNYGGDAFEFKRLALIKLADIRDAAQSYSSASIDPSLVIFRDAILSAVTGFETIIDAFFEFEITLDGVEVDPDGIAGLTMSNTTLEWCGTYNTDGGQVLFEIIGTQSKVIGDITNFVAYSVDYGVGINTLAYAVPISGTAGADELRGTSGADILDGLGGNDKLYGRRGDDTLYGRAGKDRLFGDGGADKLLGGGGRDILKGGSGKDILEGGGGDDFLYGNGGADRLIGGKGTDVLTGGAGKDVFVFEPNQDLNKVKDFRDGVDKLDLSAFGFNNKTEAKSHFREVGSATDDVVKFAFDGTVIKIFGIDLGDINNSDVII